MILETHVNGDMKAHLCMIRLNGEIYYTVDVFNQTVGEFLPTVKVFNPGERHLAIEFAKNCIK